jgi:DNA-directed RNA polymerase subunit beta'
VLLSEVVPQEIPFQLYNKVLGKKDLAELIDQCYRLTGNKQTVLLADALMQTGFRNAMKAGISISVHDMQMPSREEGLLGQGLRPGP